MRAELPFNEIMRIKKLHDLAILDTPREQSFDDVAQVAMQVCDVPIAVVSLVDQDRQWFKSCLGLDGTETPRDVAFCAHAILSPDDITVVDDATKDLRFMDNALVTGEPYIRFYAGAPLVTDEGYALGTLCVVDYKPRQMTANQINALKALARQVMQLIRLKTTHDAMQQYSGRLQLIADKAPVLIGELNFQQRYTFNNRRYTQWLQPEATHFLGKTPADIFPEDSLHIIESAIAAAFDGKSINVEIAVNGRVIDMIYLPRIQNKSVIGVYEVGTDVTERKIQSEALQKERERLAAIIEGTNIGTWEWNVQTGELLFNERWASMLGYELADLMPISVETWRGLMHPDDLQHAEDLLAKNFSGEAEFFDVEFRMRKKNGDWQWVHSRGKVVSWTEDRRPVLMSGMHADISAIKTAYIQLEENEDLLRSMLSNFPGAAYRCKNNSERTILYLSSAVHQLTGYTQKDFMENNGGVNFTAIMHPDDVESHKDKIAAALAQHTSFQDEYRIQRADGQWRRVQELGRGVYAENGDIQFIDGFIWDITERYEAETYRKVMSNKMTSLYQLAPMGIILHRWDDKKVIEANPEMYRMVGYTEQEFKALNYRMLTPEIYAESDALQIESLKTTGRYGPYEKHYIHKDGHLVPVVLNGVRIENEIGEEQVWSIIQDVTEQKRIERMKSEFISTVSHELRTPLTSISGSLGLIANNMLGAVPEKIRSMLTIAHKNSQRLTLLINDLLDMEKLVAGKMQFDMQLQRLLPLVEQAVVENKSYADQHAVTYVIKNNAPSASISVDAFRFQQVLNNFLSNAAKFSPPNNDVEISLEYVGDYVRINVHDFGSGIPDEFKARIFEKFSQADSSDSRQKGGTGLGLAISKELVERMGGRIGFESKHKHGSTFYAEFKREFGF